MQTTFNFSEERDFLLDDESDLDFLHVDYFGESEETFFGFDNFGRDLLFLEVE